MTNAPEYARQNVRDELDFVAWCCDCDRLFGAEHYHETLQALASAPDVETAMLHLRIFVLEHPPVGPHSSAWANFLEKTTIEYFDGESQLYHEAQEILVRRLLQQLRVDVQRGEAWEPYFVTVARAKEMAEKMMLEERSTK